MLTGTVGLALRMIEERVGILGRLVVSILGGLAMFLVAIPVILLAVALGAAALPLGLLVGVLGIGLVAAVGTALSGIFQAALYRYATTGHAADAFSEDDLRGAFRPRTRGWGSAFGG